MQHSMKLLESSYDRIVSGLKTMEIRLYDQKRQNLSIGDTIQFLKLPDMDDQVEVEILALLRYKSFRDLINDVGIECDGYPKDYPVDNVLTGIYRIYSREEEQRYGVVGIQIKLLNRAKR